MKSIAHIIIVSLAIFFLMSCGEGNTMQELKTEKEVLPIKVKSMTVNTKDIPIYKTYYGEVKFNQSVELGAEMPGTIKRLAVKEGQRVRAGQTLLTYPRDANNIEIENKQIEQANIQLAELEKNYARQKRLFEKGAVNRVSVEGLKTQIDLQKNTIEQLRIGVKKSYSIKAPFSGILTAVHVEKGQQLQSGTPLFTLAKSNDTEVEFYALPNEVKHIAIGKNIEIIDGKNILKGKIKEKASQLDPMRKALKVAATFNNTKQTLLVGSTMEMRLLVETKKDALVIPEEALSQRGQSFFVYVVKDGKAMRQKISIEKRVGLDVLVKNGLTKGDQLVTVGMNKLKNNALVEVIK